MKWRILGTVVLMVLAGTDPAMSQAKVGTTGMHILERSLSARSSGMGETGVALVHTNSYMYNPASLALRSTGMHLTSSFYLLDNLVVPSTSFQTVSASVGGLSLQDQWFLAIAFYRPRIKAEAESFPSTIVPTGQSFRYDTYAYSTTVALGYAGKIEGAFGFTIRYLHEQVFDYKADGTSVDWGIVFRVPFEKFFSWGTGFWKQFYLTPSVGFAYLNIGDSITFVRSRFPLPKSWRAGGAIEAGLKSSSRFGEWKQISLLMALEGEKLISEYGYAFAKYGMEVGFLEAAYLRIGGEDRDRRNTYGLTLSSKGLTRSLVSYAGLRGGVFEYFADHVAVDYSYSDYEYRQSDVDAGGLHEVLFTWWP